MLTQLPLYQQAILTLAAMILFSSFVLLAQNRVLAMIHVFAWQGLLVALTTALVAYDSAAYHLYFSAALTVMLKVLFIPWLLHRLVKRMGIDREMHEVGRPALVLMTAAGLVIFCYYVAQPIHQLSIYSGKVRLLARLINRLLP